MAHRSLADRVVVAVAILAVAIGLIARVRDLGVPLFFGDEAASALRATGHDAAEFSALFDGKVIPAATLQALGERVVPPPDGTLRSIARDEPQRGPLYYEALRLTVARAGTSAARYRLLSLAFGILGVALAFGAASALATPGPSARRAGLIAMAMTSVSPIFVLYSRQAREYVAYADAVLLAIWLLAAALRRGGTPRWIAYAAAVAVGMYLDPLFVLVAVALVVGVAIARVRGAVATSRLVSTIAATVAGTAAFVPWVATTAAMRSNAQVADQLAWVKTFYPLPFALEKGTFVLGALFFDADFRWHAAALVAIAAIVVALAGFVAAMRFGDRLAASLVASLLVVPQLAILALDVVERAHFSTIARYLFSSWCALELGVAVGFAALIARPRARRLAVAAIVALVCASAVSDAFGPEASMWWTNLDRADFRAVAAMIDRTPRPIVYVGSDADATAMTLARYLRPSDDVVLFRGPNVPPAPADRVAFLIFPTQPQLADARRANDVRDLTGDVALAPFLRGGAAASDAPPSTIWRMTRR